MIYINEMKNIHLGQNWDIYWHGYVESYEKVPTEEDYYMMTANKTGVLARMACNLTLTYLEIDRKIIEKVVKFTENIGIAF